MYRAYLRDITFKDPLVKFLFLLMVNRTQKHQPTTPFQGCSLNVTNGTTGTHNPVILYNEGPDLTLARPDNGTLSFPASKHLLILCPGPFNTLVNTNSRGSEATCEITSQLKMDGNLQNFESLQCRRPVSADIKDGNKRCGYNGKEMLIGYELRAAKEQDFVNLIKVCYNETQTSTLYTQHTVYGSNIKYATRSTPRPFFSIRGIGADNITTHAYKRFMQRAIFKYLLGSDELATKYINAKSFLSRGHLAPHADFLLSNTQRSSYFYINACPQWQAINGGNWNILEMTVRKTAEIYNKTLTILTGTHGVLELLNHKNESVKMYLGDGEKLPVPKYLWKIVYDPNTKDGIALINYNNPFVKNVTDVEFCENICDVSGWGLNHWSNLKKGYIFCCEIQKLRNFVSYIPNLDVQGIFPGIFLKVMQ